MHPISGLRRATIDEQMRFPRQTKAVVTDSHFLIPLIVFLVGLALLITLR